MKKALITFANNEVLEILEDDLFIPVKAIDADKTNKGVYSLCPSLKLTCHMDYGLVPSFLDVIHDTKYFYLHRKPDTLYFVNAIVKIEDLE